ncbi:MAG TPA: NlpC/P60 family protein [Thermomicrobiales bacterium]|nr:NlpC/P60 family protein [Thermomicrobiales bacterium]
MAVVIGLITLAPPAARAADLGAGSAAANTSGSDLLLRAAPGYDAQAIGDYPSGANVTIQDGPIYAADGSAWYAVDGGYLPASGLSPAGTATYAQEAPADPNAAAPADNGSGGQAVQGDQTWTDPNAGAPAAGDGSGQQGDGTWTDPNAGAPAATDGQIAQGDQTTATDPNVAPATDPNAGAPATDPNAAPATDPNAGAPADGGQNAAGPGPAQTPIATAWIAGTNGDGAECRTAADFNAPSMGVLPEGSQVDVVGNTQGEWQPVNCFGAAGFVHASFIAWQAPAAAPTTADTAAPAATDAAAAPATDNTADAANCAAGKRGKNGNNNNCGGGNNTNSAANNGGGGGSGGGQQIANYAQKYVGYPYVYAGAGPDAFDCSGFAEWVIKNTLGMDITHDMFQQVQDGSPVSRNDLQPGDLVFFQDTFRPGLSHVGVYIGNGQFVNAENESTGVVVSDINSDYYSSRFYAARRLW